MLRQTDLPLVGTLLNKVTAQEERYYYYYYNYYRPYSQDADGPRWYGRLGPLSKLRRRAKRRGGVVRASKDMAGRTLSRLLRRGD